MTELTKLVTALQNKQQGDVAPLFPNQLDYKKKTAKSAKWRSCRGLTWTPGIQPNKNWNNTQRQWFFHTFKEKDYKGWKKWRAESLRAQLKDLE